MRCGPSAGARKTGCTIATGVFWRGDFSATRRWWQWRESCAVLSGNCCAPNPATKRNPDRSKKRWFEGNRLTRRRHPQNVNAIPKLNTGAALRRQITVANPRCLVSVKAGRKNPSPSTRHLDCWKKAQGELKECRIGPAQKNTGQPANISITNRREPNSPRLIGRLKPASTYLL